MRSVIYLFDMDNIRVHEGVTEARTQTEFRDKPFPSFFFSQSAPSFLKRMVHNKKKPHRSLENVVEAVDATKAVLKPGRWSCNL